MESFHNEGLVHGDLHEPNMICSGENIVLLDLDWGGQAREALYPCASLNPELTDGQESIDQEIMKDNDIQILENTLKQLQNV